MVSITATVLAQKQYDTKPLDFYSYTRVVPEKPKSTKVDNTPVFWCGMVVGTRQDVIDGKIDMSDRDGWKP